MCLLSLLRLVYAMTSGLIGFVTCFRPPAHVNEHQKNMKLMYHTIMSKFQSFNMSDFEVIACEFLPVLCLCAIPNAGSVPFVDE